MALLPLEAKVRQLPGLATIDLRGDIDGAAEEVLNAAYNRAEGQDPPEILLNFEEVAYINSKGIALLVVLLGRARTAGRRLLACGLSDHYREIFDITRLSDYITVCTGDAFALTRFESPSRRTGREKEEQDVVE